jgi:eukaryotic-like serine/threonine-protein kinase
MAADVATVVRFGVFEAHLKSGELRKHGVRVRLQDQPFQVLALLLQRPGDVVTRDEIQRALWPADTFVDFDHGLNKAINRLRDALGDSADTPRFIETLPKRGYRFIAPVESPTRHETKPDPPNIVTPSDIPLVASPQISTRRTKWWVLAGAIALLAGAAAALLYLKRPAVLTDRDTVLLADFDNRTGDTAFDYTLRQALSIGLESSSLVRTLPDQKVADTLRLMHRTPDEKLTSSLAREVCERAGAKAVLGGYVARLGSEYVIGLTAENCATGDTLAQEQVRAGRKEDVLDRLDRGVAALRTKLGDSLGSIQGSDRHVHDVLSTSSLEAFEAYTNGERMVLAGRSSLALMRHATELDPEFAYAHAALGLIYGNLSEASLSSASTRRAYELRDRVSDWERYYITAQYHFRVTGDLSPIVPLCQSWIQQYPRERTAHNRLAFAYRQLGQYDRALAEYQTARQVGGSHPLDLLMLAKTFTNLDRLDEAATIIHGGLAANPDDSRFRAEQYILDFLRGHTRLDQPAGSSLANPADDELRFLQSNTEAYFGRLVKAHVLAQEAIESTRQKGLNGRAAVWVAAAAMREALVGRVDAARQQAHAALDLTSGWDARSLAALALARAGEVDAAATLADALSAELPAGTLMQNYWLPAIRADIELTKGNATRAIDLLRPAAAYELTDTASSGPSLYPTYIKGLAYLRAHDGTSAAAEFQKIRAHPGLVANDLAGALARLGLARAYALSGDISKARAAYDEFLTQWKDADADLPLLKEARTESALLPHATAP